MKRLIKTTQPTFELSHYVNFPTFAGTNKVQYF